VIPFTFPTYVQGDGTIACRAKVITDTTGLVRWIDYTPIKFVASMTNMGTTNNDGSQAIELITQTTGLVKGIDYIVVYVDSSATVPWSTNANGYIPCYSAPYSLFATSEQGVWYDPSDFSTLFQDSAGTTPVTAVEQPVGLMLDKSKGLVLGAELVVNGGFDTNIAGWTVATGGWSWESGKAKLTSDGSPQGLTQSNVVAGKWYMFSFDVSSTGGAIGFQNSSGAIIADGSSGTVSGVFLSPGASCGFKRVSGSPTGTIDNISVREIPGNHATQATAASRPILKQDGNGKYYLLFDGVDDSMATGSIDFTATDKMTVFAGVRRLRSASLQMLLELSAAIGTNNGAFNIPTDYPLSTTYSYDFGTKGTIQTDANVIAATYPVPHTGVVTGIGSISGDEARLRVNGVQVAATTTDQGTGNYGNYPLYIGRRGGTTLPFNGNLYSLIVRGAQSSAAQITSAETYVNGKTGAY